MVVKLKALLLLVLIADVMLAQTLRGRVQISGKMGMGNGSAVQFTLATLNLQHGQGTDGNFDYQRQVDEIANADIVTVQERSTSDTGWDTALTNAGFTQVVFKAHWGSPGDGNAIWTKSRVTMLTSYTFDMANGVNPTSGSAVFGWDGVTDVRRSLAAIKAQIQGKQFYVVSLHLVSSSGEDNSNTNFASQRVDQINSALGWASSTLTGGLPIFIAGDSNIPVNYPMAPERTYTADASTDVLTSPAHGFTDGTAVALRNSGGGAPGGLAVGDSLYALAPVFYVRDATTNTFKLSASWGGPPIDLTSNGTGTNFISATQWDLFHKLYYDMWQEGLASGKASAPWGDRNGDGNPDMPLDLQLTRTHDTRNLDRIMKDRASTGVTLVSITVPDDRAICPHALVAGGAFPACSPEVTIQTDTPDDFGVEPTDHNLLEAVFTIQ